MNGRRIFVVILLIAMMMTSVALPYVVTFGTGLSNSREVWGQFGDYFGGVLNPILAILAFFGLLWSTAIQQREAREATRHISLQTELARREMSDARADRIARELLDAIKEIDQRLVVLLAREVSPVGTQPRLTIELIAAEAERIRINGGESSALQAFAIQATTPGTVVEAPVREMIYLMSAMRDFLEQYSSHKAAAYAPMLIYYADKTRRTVPLLEAVGGIPEDSWQFFTTIGDLHH